MDDGHAPPQGQSYPRVVFVVPGQTPPVPTPHYDPELMPAWVFSAPRFFRRMADIPAAHGHRTKRARVAAATEPILQEVTGCCLLGEECAICLQDFRADEAVRAMPYCSHAFHQHCISNWLRRKAVCPLCRRNLLPTAPTTEEEEEEEEEEDQHDGGGEEDQDEEDDVEWVDGAIGGESC